MKHVLLACAPTWVREWWWRRCGHDTDNAVNTTLPKLHLGCGENYLSGYVNIDYPSTKHTTQLLSVADVRADVRTLTYPRESIGEIRSHHVFEHFGRGTALRLLLDWYDWLVVGGRLIIETPDFEKCVRSWRKTSDVALKMRLMRHVFGSHEAEWAVHKDGWYEKKFVHHMGAVGFGDFWRERTTHHGLHNIAIYARKLEPLRSRVVREHAAEELLRLSMVDSSPVEERMLTVWVKEMKGQRT